MGLASPKRVRPSLKRAEHLLPTILGLFLVIFDFRGERFTPASALRGIAFAYPDAAWNSIRLPVTRLETRGARVPRDQQCGGFSAVL